MPCFDKASVDTLETISLMQGDCNDLLVENELKINSHVLPVFFFLLLDIYKETLSVKKTDVTTLEGNLSSPRETYFLPPSLR